MEGVIEADTKRMHGEPRSSWQHFRRVAHGAWRRGHGAEGRRQEAGCNGQLAAGSWQQAVGKRKEAGGSGQLNNQLAARSRQCAKRIAHGAKRNAVSRITGYGTGAILARAYEGTGQPKSVR